MESKSQLQPRVEGWHPRMHDELRGDIRDMSSGREEWGVDPASASVKVEVGVFLLGGPGFDLFQSALEALDCGILRIFS